MKKALSPSAAEKLRFAAAVLPLSLAVCLAIPEMGFLSSFPFIVLIPFGVAFYYDEPLFLSITGALSAAIVSIAADKNGVYTVWFVIISVVVILLSVFAARLIKEHNRQRIRLRIVLAYLLLIAMCVGYGFCLGNPVLALLSRNHVKNYLKTNYSTETFSSICPGYDVMQGAYIHSCAVHTNGEIHTVQVI
ncbi:MAG TPA: hypothetical protein DCY74_00855, partial [Clostridiales bacterium]|nr:hypothetical protein [Clostridiales bacterium]